MRNVQSTESISSDEEDDSFEILTAENLFSTLLSRVIYYEILIYTISKYLFNFNKILKKLHIIKLFFLNRCVI